MKKATDTTITDWSATRSAATMTIEGTDSESDQRVKITGVERIQTNGDFLLAVCRDGSRVRLSP